MIITCIQMKKEELMKFMNELKTNRHSEPQYYYQDVKSNEKTQWVEKNYKLISFIWDLEKPSQHH